MEAFPRQLNDISQTRSPLWHSFVVPTKIQELVHFLPSLEGKTAVEKAVLSSRLFDETTLVSRHTWIQKKENVFSWTQLNTFLYCSKAVTGLCEGFTDIWSDEKVEDKELKRFLKSLNRHTNALGKQLAFNKSGISMGFTLEIMIPKDMNSVENLRDVAEFALRMLGYNENGTFFVRHYHKSDGNYLGIFVTTRKHLKEAREIVVSRAQTDRYRSSLTGKMCKKGARGAVLVQKKGDVLKTMKARFSETHDFLDLSPKRFREVMAMTKACLSEVFDMLGFAEDKRIVLGEYDGNDEGWTDYNKCIIRRYNKVFEKVEEELNEVYKTVLSMDESVKMWFKDLVISLRRMQRNVVTRKEDISRTSDILVRFDAPYVVAKRAIEYMKTRMMQKVLLFEQSVGILVAVD